MECETPNPEINDPFSQDVGSTDWIRLCAEHFSSSQQKYSRIGVNHNNLSDRRGRMKRKEWNLADLVENHHHIIVTGDIPYDHLKYTIGIRARGEKLLLERIGFINMYDDYLQSDLEKMHQPVSIKRD